MIKEITLTENYDINEQYRIAKGDFIYRLLSKPVLLKEIQYSILADYNSGLSESDIWKKYILH